MKILVVSGFLGAGKTTFIKEMAQKTKRDFVVMENEYGEVGIDKTLLDKEKDINIWELTEGCICCSMKSDFASSILTIANTLDPEYLIVEPTGVGVLSNVIHNIQQIEYERISLLSPVTIVDANCFDHYMRDYRDIFEDQLKAAGTIVISKRNFDTPEEMDALVSKIREVNPDARIPGRALQPYGVVLVEHLVAYGPERELHRTRTDGHSKPALPRPYRYFTSRSQSSDLVSGTTDPRCLRDDLPGQRIR